MRLKTPKPIRLIALAGIALFIGSCAKNTTIIYGSGEDDGLPETPQKGTTLVAFNASIESRNLTRAMSPMKKESRVPLCLPKVAEYHHSGNFVCRRTVYHFFTGCIVRK